MFALLLGIAGTVYGVATVHGPSRHQTVLPQHDLPRPGLGPADQPIRVPGSLSRSRSPNHLLGIMNGVTADPGQFPWMVDLQIIDTGQSKCGGSLIDPIWVVTAAHCVETMLASDLRVVIGEHDIAEHDEFEQIRGIESVFIEPDFDKGPALPNDIALIKLDQPAVYNERVAPIQMSRDDSAFGECSVAGWGAAGVDPDTGLPVYPSALQTVDMTRLTLEQCQSKMEGYRITENMTCAEGKEGSDVCWGDSGGSLTCPPIGGPGPWTLVGVTSWGVACGYVQYPSVYTRISQFIPWIESVTGVKVPPA